MNITNIDSLCVLNTLLVPEIEKLLELKEKAEKLPDNVEKRLIILVDMNNQANTEIKIKSQKF